MTITFGRIYITQPRTFFIVLFSWIFLTITSVQAQEITGEIINVNYRDKAAFIDLGSESLRVGDVVMVEESGEKIYLEAISVSDAVTTLSPSKNPAYPSQDDQFKEIIVGAVAKKVWSSPSTQNSATTQSALQGVNEIPVIDPQVLIKPNIANESIQSLDARLDKMVESNVKLFNTLTELLNEKKEWDLKIQVMNKDMASLQVKLQDQINSNAELNKVVTQAKLETAGAIADREKYKKSAEDIQIKFDELRKQLDNLTRLVDEEMKNVAP